MTADTILPLCSITKQFVCLVLAKALQEPGAAGTADAAMREMLPSNLADNKELTIERMTRMQSGIRDYWALTVLWGAQPDGIFTVAKDAPVALQKLGHFHFPPGTQHSYSNVNFHVLGRIAKRLTGRPLGQALKEQVFTPAGMSTTELRPDPNDLPGPCIGYEGNAQHGFFRALNRMEWSGDAGIVASLNDMISYEQYLDRQQTDPNSPYRKISQSPTFIDGTPAFYGWGLRHNDIAGHHSSGHGGGLRGFRLYRRHAPDARLSAVLMFNHEADPDASLTYLLEKALLEPEADTIDVPPAQGWEGAYFDSEAELAITVARGQSSGELMINVSSLPEKVKCSTPCEAESRSMKVVLSDETVTLHRPRENRIITARRIPPSSVTDCSAFTGDYQSDETDSVFHVTGSAGMLYGSFDGYLGKGPAHLMKELGGDTWYLICQRSLDSSPPGSWTVVFKRDGNGTVVGAVVGCWLARKVPYVKI